MVAEPLAFAAGGKFSVPATATDGAALNRDGLVSPVTWKLRVCPFSSAGRITSYNVCYTKLLREALHLLVLSHAQLLVDLLPARHHVRRERLADLAEPVEPAAQLGVVRRHLAGDGALDVALVRRSYNFV